MPLPDEIEAGIAERVHDPLTEQFQREANPWSPGGQQGLGAGVPPTPFVVAPTGPTISMVPPPAPPGSGPATPWSAAPGAMGPADFGMDGRVPPPAGGASLPMGGFNLSAVVEAPPGDEQETEDEGPALSADERVTAVAYLNLSEEVGPVAAAERDSEGFALAMRVSMRGDAYDATKAKTAIGALEPGDQWSWDYGVSVRSLQMAEGAQTLWSLDCGYGLDDEGAEGPRETVYTDVDKLMTAVGTAVANQQARVAARKLRDKLRTSYGLSQDGEHQATVAWNLAEDGGVVKDGVLWKVLCKTGTLALSPGPGQIDVEKPLELTPDLFMAAKTAYDEGAYEHVLIPKKHEDVGDVMANTGTVSALDVLDHKSALKDVRLSAKAKTAIKGDPAETLYMLGGMSFTDAEVKKKAAEGSILNCSVGFKFNVAPNKLTGKKYPVAIEHVALTNQPWVYGLPAFGGTDLAGGAAPDEVVWDGVFMSADSQGAVALVEDPHATTPPALPEGGAPGELPTTPNNGTTSGDDPVPARVDDETTDPALETILATHQAEIERLTAENAEKDVALSQRDALLSQTAEQLHKGTVATKIKALQDQKGPGGGPRYTPGVLTRVEAVLLAAKPSLDGSGDGALSLSASVPAEGGGLETKEFNTVEGLVDFILSAVPESSGDDADDALAAATLLAQRPGGPNEDETTKTKAGADAIEKRLHPERFGPDGARISAAERKKR